MSAGGCKKRLFNHTLLPTPCMYETERMYGKYRTDACLCHNLASSGRVKRDGCAIQFIDVSAWHDMYSQGSVGRNDFERRDHGCREYLSLGRKVQPRDSRDRQRQIAQTDHNCKATIGARIAELDLGNGGTPHEKRAITDALRHLRILQLKRLG